MVPRPAALAAALMAMFFFMVHCTRQECSTDEGTARQIVNPNGDSELALLMRDLFDEGMAVKIAIAEGRHPDYRLDPADIFTAHATEPEKAASSEYQELGRAYLAAARALKEAAPEERKAYFQGVVHSCMACHEQLCPGPTRKIRRLYYDDL